MGHGLRKLHPVTHPVLEMLQLLRANPGLQIVLALLGLGVVVCLIVGRILRASGASLRPVLWFAGFFGLIVLPQLGFHSIQAFRWARQDAPRRAAIETLAGPPDAARRTAAVTGLFGADADADLLRDVRKDFGSSLTEAQGAWSVPFADGTTVLLAHFGSAAAAEQAWTGYLQYHGLNQGGRGDSVRGYRVERPTGGPLYALPFGVMLGVWTGPNDATLRNRMTTAGYAVPSSAPLKDAGSASRKNRLRSVGAPVGIGLLVFLATAFLFRGSSWAASAPAATGAAPIPEAELRSRLTAVNRISVPIRIVATDNPSEFIATWRFTDPHWVDLARVRHFQRTHRLRLRLDLVTRSVRVTESDAQWEVATGADMASLKWKAKIGIVLFQRDQRRLYGVQFDGENRVRTDPNHGFELNLTELKVPLMEVVTRAGWTWHPVIWDAPTWLRWLTG